MNDFSLTDCFQWTEVWRDISRWSSWVCCEI